MTKWTNETSSWIVNKTITYKKKNSLDPRLSPKLDPSSSHGLKSTLQVWHWQLPLFTIDKSPTTKETTPPWRTPYLIQIRSSTTSSGGGLSPLHQTVITSMVSMHSRKTTTWSSDKVFLHTNYSVQSQLINYLTNVSMVKDRKGSRDRTCWKLVFNYIYNDLK